MNYRIATNAFGKEMNVLDQPPGTLRVAHMDSNLNAIRRVVDIMDKLGCRDLENLVKYYMEHNFNQ